MKHTKNSGPQCYSQRKLFHGLREMMADLTYDGVVVVVGDGGRLVVVAVDNGVGGMLL